jgi:hypothetical protein
VFRVYGGTRRRRRRRRRGHSVFEKESVERRIRRRRRSGKNCRNNARLVWEITLKPKRDRVWMALSFLLQCGVDRTS